MSKYIVENEIAQIIADFRKNSIGIPINQEHVHKWVSQFSKDTQDIILFETLHILKKWYFSEAKINSFLDKFIDILKDKNVNATDNDPLNGICFLDVQENGKSQSQLIEMLKTRVDKKYGIDIRTGTPEDEKYYVYLDDGLYTGSTIRKDIKRLIEMIPDNSQIDIICIFACQSGTNYSKIELEKIAETKNIKLDIYWEQQISNDKTIKKCGDTFSCQLTQDCLWPSSNLKNATHITPYVQKLEEINEKKLYYCFRNAKFDYTKGIFSSLANRDIVEEEFLKKGIEIIEDIQEHKGLYPLGYNITPSFGLGSFCATALNISNTCPIVLWWGNVFNKGNELDRWYPLLPRRINNNCNPYDNDRFTEETKDDGYDTVYDMCPDCGCGISLRNDGGNGFCIDCAWNH